jgi:hypothetical protein
MSSKSAGQRSQKTRERDQASPSTSIKAIRADAFDDFIEGQLQKTENERAQSDVVVCHVY